MTKVAIVQLDDRSNEELGAQGGLVQMNTAYAEAQGYAHIFVRNPDTSIPVYWAKVYAVMKTLESGFDIVAWLDTDVVVHDTARRIEPFFETPDQSFIYSKDPPICKSNNPFNAGVFFCRGDFALRLMREWWALLTPCMPMWTKRDGKWICSQEVFGGLGYEQGEFTDKLLHRFSGSAYFREVHWKTLQSPYPVKESFTVHFLGGMRSNATAYVAYTLDATG